jgi:RimJ/RimL family protein N-acetyltransferase
MMKITPYAVDGKLKFPLPLYESMPIAEAVTENGDSFVIVAGLDKHMAEQVKRYSLDENDADLQENTSDKKRFGEGSYEEWYSKGRVPFALIHEPSEAVTAIAWFGPKPVGSKSLRYLTPEEAEAEKKLTSDIWHTISYRCYNPFRGKGLMRDFVQFGIETYLSQYPDGKIWAIINVENPASMKLAEKLGFKPMPEASHPEEHLTVMVRE